MGKPCAACARSLPKGAFAKPQWQKSDGSRRCKECTASGMPVLPKDTEKALRSSRIDRAIDANAEEAEFVLVGMNDKEQDSATTCHVVLQNCVYVGHTATDMDSIGSAIAAAEFWGGTPTRASEINTETKFALQYWGVKVPPPFASVAGQRPVCLVDHNQASQLAPGVSQKNIVGIIDHHALQSGTVTTDVPIFVDIRPWGSACTIIAHYFMRHNRRISRPTAGLMLSGILSDTLNLRSPTTTEYDELAVAVLAKTARIEDTNAYAQQLFRAKSQELDAMSGHQLVHGDSKLFDFVQKDGEPLHVSFGVIETTDTTKLIERREELMVEMRALKREEHVHCSFLAVVDILKLRSTLLVCGVRERVLAEAAFGGSVTSEGLLDLGPRVSRKKNFVPPISEVLAKGDIKLPPSTTFEAQEVFGEVVHECTPHSGCTVMRTPVDGSSSTPTSSFLGLDFPDVTASSA